MDLLELFLCKVSWRSQVAEAQEVPGSPWQSECNFQKTLSLSKHYLSKNMKILLHKLFIHQPNLQHIDQNHNMIVASVRALTSIKTFSKEGATRNTFYGTPVHLISDTSDHAMCSKKEIT